MLGRIEGPSATGMDEDGGVEVYESPGGRFYVNKESATL